MTSYKNNRSPHKLYKSKYNPELVAGHDYSNALFRVTTCFCIWERFKHSICEYDYTINLKEIHLPSYFENTNAAPYSQAPPLNYPNNKSPVRTYGLVTPTMSEGGGDNHIWKACKIT